MENANVGERKPSLPFSKGDMGTGLDMLGVGERVHGESSSNDNDELNDSSTSIGRSNSVCVGEGAWEGKRDDGQDSIRGEEENMSMLPGVAGIGLED